MQSLLALGNVMGLLWSKALEETSPPGSDLQKHLLEATTHALREVVTGHAAVRCSRSGFAKTPCPNHFSRFLIRQSIFTSGRKVKVINIGVKQITLSRVC